MIASIVTTWLALKCKVCIQLEDQLISTRNFNCAFITESTNFRVSTVKTMLHLLCTNEPCCFIESRPANSHAFRGRLTHLQPLSRTPTSHVHSHTYSPGIRLRLLTLQKYRLNVHVIQLVFQLLMAYSPNWIKL